MKIRMIPALVAAFLLGVLSARLGRGDTSAPATGSTVAVDRVTTSSNEVSKAGLESAVATPPHAGEETAPGRANSDPTPSPAGSPWRTLLWTVLDELGDEWVFRHLSESFLEGGSSVRHIVLRKLLSSEDPDLIEACGRVIEGEMPPGLADEELSPEEEERREREWISLRNQCLQEVATGANPARRYWLSLFVGGTWDEPDALPIVKRILESGPSEIKARMLEAVHLRHFSGSPQEAELIPILGWLARHGSTVEVRSRALQSVSDHVPREWWRLTCEAMFQDPSSEVRRTAIGCLAMSSRATESLRSLVTLAKDSGRDLEERRAAAVRVLEFLKHGSNERWRGAVSTADLESLQRVLEE